MSDWADYRQEVFGEPYLVWHDGADFDELFGLLVDSAGSEGWAEVAERLAAAVQPS